MKNQTLVATPDYSTKGLMNLYVGDTRVAQFLNPAMASHIVCAVNAHEQLLEAATNVLKMIKDGDLTTVEINELENAITFTEGGK